jgi:hypothetical protein
MPEVCGAKNRRGTPCQRAPATGKKRCKLHGGASTGPKTARGKARAAVNGVEHGGYTQLATYERLLASHDPALYAEMPKDTSLERELRWARMQLAALARSGRSTGAAKEILTEIRLLAQAQHELRPGGDATGAFEDRLTVVGAEAASPPAAEAEGPCS